MDKSELSRGARQCLELLQDYSRRFRAIYPFQTTIARRLGKTDRHVRRYLSELKTAGLLTIEKSGPRPATYRLVVPVEKPVENSAPADQNVRSMSGQMSGLADPVLITELKERKLQAGLHAERDFHMPPPTITTEYGRTESNPEFLHAQAVLRSARERIARANNPRAYANAILNRECGPQRKPPDSETGNSRRKIG